jgi:hypothetical protein
MHGTSQKRRWVCQKIITTAEVLLHLENNKSCCPEQVTLTRTGERNIDDKKG